MKYINILGAALALLLSFTTLNAVAADAVKKHHVVFHITDNDPAKWSQVLNNAGNLQKNIGKDNIEIEVVANGPGLEMFKLESPVGDRMGDAIKNGIEMKACATTMKAMKVTEKDLYPGVGTVPGGVIEIMQKQESGWAYLKI
jgi:hypothetical protein